MMLHRRNKLVSVYNNGGYLGYRQPERDMQWLSGLFW